MSLLPKRSALIAVALLPFFAAGAALAQDASPPAHPGGPHGGPCRADVQKLCSGVQPGGGRIIDCLKQHAADVSQACHDAMAAHEKAHPHGGGDDSAPDPSK
jgi:hypothetical protein